MRLKTSSSHRAWIFETYRNPCKAELWHVAWPQHQPQPLLLRRTDCAHTACTVSSLRSNTVANQHLADLNRVNETFALCVQRNLTAYTQHCRRLALTFGTRPSILRKVMNCSRFCNESCAEWIKVHTNTRKVKWQAMWAPRLSAASHSSIHLQIDRSLSY